MSRWPRAPLHEILTPDRDEVIVEPDVSYRMAGIYSFGRGVFEREAILGAETSYKSLFRLHEQQFIVSRLNGWEGAVDVVAPHVDGCFVSNEYPTFSVDPAKADPRFVRWLCRWPAFWELLVPRGSMVRRKRVQTKQLLDVQVPLPPIDEQRRVAARLDLVADRHTGLVERGTHASSLVAATVLSIASRPDLGDEEKAAAGWSRVRLGEIMRSASDIAAVDPTAEYPNLGILSFGRGVFEKPPIDGNTTSAKSLNKVHAGQFIYSRLFAFEGAYAFVPERFDGYFVSNEFPTFDPDPDRLDARWLAACLRSSDRWAELRGSSKGLGLRRQRVPAEAVLAYEVWLPPIEEQRRMVAMIDRLGEISERRERARELMDALVPAILNQAFAGLG